MGKPFRVELGHVEETYAWALEQDVIRLSHYFRCAQERPLLAVGSGGSFSAASYATFLHERLSGLPSEALTPMQFVSFRSTAEVGALFLSAGGRNHDILAALRTASTRDLRQVGSMSLRAASPLRTISRAIGADLFASGPPCGSDGFLATNSLIVFFALLYRARAALDSTLDKLPSTFSRLTQATAFDASHLREVVAQRHVIVLYGPSMLPAALDLESKFHEAGLAAVQLADFRNFAHGRHNWIAKNASETAVLALVTADTDEIAKATLELLKDRVPIAKVQCGGPESLHSFAALRAVFEATSLAGIARGIDPGRPGVPAFGRRIYNLRGFRSTRVSQKAELELAARRKVGNAWTGLKPSQKATWKTAASNYLDRLRAARFGSIVIDFDGTLCSSQDRFLPLAKEAASELDRLLRGGLVIGVATGRGKSARNQIRESLSADLWKKLWIGYYNGADIAQLSDDAQPNVARPQATALGALDRYLKSDGIIRTLAVIERRPVQFTLQPLPLVGLDNLYQHASSLVRRCPAGLKALMSSHSVDIIPESVSKTAVVRHVSSLATASTDTLCIGDAGEYPGNDCELLAEPFSLSCDRVSPDVTSCWNFSPASRRGAEASLFYLRHLIVQNGVAKLRLPIDTTP